MEPAGIRFIKKRDSRVVPFDITKIDEAIFRAARTQGGTDRTMSRALAEQVASMLAAERNETPDVEHVQDVVEKVLIENGHARTAKAYILYRNERTRVREMKTRLMNTLRDLSFTDAKDLDLKRENANIDGDTPMGTMLRYGSEAAKAFYKNYLLSPEHSRAHEEGDIHIHDLDFLSLTTTCCQIDIKKLFNGGFNTGHGFLREPNSIQCASALACIAIQSNQNDQHGGQSIPNFEYGLAPGVARSFIKNIDLALDMRDADEDFRSSVKAALSGFAFPTGEYASFRSILGEEGLAFVRSQLVKGIAAEEADRVVAKAVARTDKDTYQAMEGLLHNLNTMHSRAGAQVPFSSINYGTDTSAEGRMVIRNTLLAEDAGLGNGETPIFPIHIFKVREGYSFNPEDPNYDLFKLACRVSAKRLFPNFSFMEAPINREYLQGDDPDHEVAYMGCRTRVMANRYDKSRETTFGRGNLSFTTINLPRLGLKHRGDIEGFFEDLNKVIDLVFSQLLERFEIQSHKRCRNYPFLMGQGIWLDSDNLTSFDEVGEILKHGTLTTGFIGLAECLKALLGVHHGESAEAQELGLRIVRTIRERSDAQGEKTGLNFTVIATPAEGLAGRFVKYDRKLFGSIPGITDRDYYTNSFHIPVYFPITAFNKIRLEAPYHAFTNGGHISYVEVDGDPLNNLQAFEDIVKAMKEMGIGYGSINHPVDRDPVCGYTGIIGDVCPRCGRRDGEGIPLSTLKRLKGYVCDSRSSDERSESRDKIANIKL
ncbi:MAG: anaerobic ribonucleoside triphosphate reductase [Mailhella sp.]|nr:anaerobic ribonucleoside triphosphate reductase [Mailhella sp.]